MTVGERLREARQRQNVSLHAIAEKTNISVRFLDAIEKGQYEKLPGGIFTRGFIRSYATQVGLDPDATVSQFLADEPSQRDDDIDEAPLSRRDGPGVGTLVMSGLGVIAAALLLVYLLAPDWIGVRSSSTPAEIVAAPLAAVDATSVPPAPAPTAVSHASPEPAAPTPAAAPPAPTTPVTPAGAPVSESPMSALRLVVTPTGRCWVQVSADGQMRVARELSAGERLTIDAAERLQITVGDAGSFSYELNGRPGKALGAAGRVARATILPSTAAQFQVQ